MADGRHTLCLNTQTCLCVRYVCIYVWVRVFLHIIIMVPTHLLLLFLLSISPLVAKENTFPYGLTFEIGQKLIYLLHNFRLVYMIWLLLLFCSWPTSQVCHKFVCFLFLLSREITRLPLLFLLLQGLFTDFNEEKPLRICVCLKIGHVIYETTKKLRLTSVWVQWPCGLQKSVKFMWLGDFDDAFCY